MAMIGSETFLPGVITQVESDYSYGYDSGLFGSTDSVLVIGTAFNGPTGIPVEVYSPEHGRYVFGKAYDSSTRQEATLIGGIEDTYQRGCRTIYAIRITGKAVEKSFNFAVETTLKFRVAGVYPSNQVKDYFMVYDNTVGDEKIKLYKPASKATIVEKMQGLVESDNSVLVTEIKLNRDYGMTQDSKLTELVRVINEHQYNNTLRVSIVDENGSDVTTSSAEAQELSIGAVMPGAYLIGRDKSLCPVNTEIEYTLVQEDSQKPYASFEGTVYKRLVMNTDVSASLPIYAQNINTLRDILRTVEIFTLRSFDFLETQGVADRAFAKDTVDYEEVNIPNFEIYKRLGSGYAITAKAEKRESGGLEISPRVRETPIEDANRIMQITDGSYSMLENLNTRYRVLTCGNFDSNVESKIPRPVDFQVASPVSDYILDGGFGSFSGKLIKVTPIIKDDEKYSPKKYVFSVDGLTGEESALVDEIYIDNVMKVVPGVTDVQDLLDAKVENGTLVMSVEGSVNTSGVVVTNGTGVAWVSGDKFDLALEAGQTITINGVDYTIASVSDDENLVLNENAGIGTGGLGQVQTNGTTITRVAGSNFNTGWAVGRIIEIDGVDYTIASVTDASEIIINEDAGASVGAAGTVITSGSAVTLSAGEEFNTGWVAGRTITINAVDYTIASITDGNNLVLNESAGFNVGATSVVDVDGFDVQWVSGDKFITGWAAGRTINLDGVDYTIASVTDADNLILNEDAGITLGVDSIVTPIILNYSVTAIDLDFSVAQITVDYELVVGETIGTLKRFRDGQYEIVNDQSFIGDVFIVNGKMLQGEILFDELKFTAIDAGSFDISGADHTYLGKKYVLAENNNVVYAFKVEVIGAHDVRPLGDITTMLSDNLDKTLIYAQSNFFENNNIIIKSGILEGTTLEEFISMLNEHPSLRKLFMFEIAEEAIFLKDENVHNVASGNLGVEYLLSADRELAYDYNKYIPYKTSDNFARQLAQHCTYTSLKTAPTHGIIGTTKISDLGLTNVANKVNAVLALEFDLYAKNAQGRNMLDRNNLPFPIGKNISIVFTQYFVNMDDGYRYIANGAAGYAGMISKLPLDQSSTSQPIDLLGTMFDLTNNQLTRLTQKGYVTIKQSFTRGPVITDGITMAPAGSSFRRLSVTRIIGGVEELIREACEPYIGKQNHSANRNSMQTAIKSRLDKLIGRLIEKYEFNMVVDPTIMKFSYIDIDYTIVPVFEIREVRNRITVKDEL